MNRSQFNNVRFGTRNSPRALKTSLGAAAHEKVIIKKKLNKLNPIQFYVLFFILKLNSVLLLLSNRFNFQDMKPHTDNKINNQNNRKKKIKKKEKKTKSKTKIKQIESNSVQ